MDDLDMISEYLAKDLSESNLYDIQGVKSKIKASLVLLIKQEKDMQSLKGVRSRFKNLCEHTERQERELIYWKNQARQRMLEQEIAEAYLFIDEIRKLDK